MKNKLEYQSRQILEDKIARVKASIRHCKRMVTQGKDTVSKFYENSISEYEQDLKDLEQLENLLNKFDLQINY